jgi:hypothetical protein
MKEAGTDVDKPAPNGFLEAVNKAMTDRKLDWNAASEAISKEQPALVEEYIATRQRETRTV